MKVNNLKKEIKKYYKAVNISEGQFEKIDKINKNPDIFLLNFKRYSVATVFASFFIFIFYSKENRLEKIATEVIYNHNKKLPSEFLVDKIVDLNSRLLKLDFKLQSSIKISEYTILGGRYCSIQGSIAAQIKMKHDGHFSTLYQSRSMGIGEGHLPYFLVKNGVEVSIWVEEGILFAKATDVKKDVQ